MIVSIAQPAYLPWLGYFDRIARSDLHVVLDDVAISRGSFANRNRILTAAGATWLTVPVHASLGGGRMRRICETTIPSERHWQQKHWDTMRFAYARAPFFGEYSRYWSEVFARDYALLVDLVGETTEHLMSALGITTPLVRSSTLGVCGVKSELVLNLCRAVGADQYVSGPFGRDYLDLPAFATAGVQVSFHEYVTPSYPQVLDGFEPNLSAVDALFNCGTDARALLTGTVRH